MLIIIIIIVSVVVVVAAAACIAGNIHSNQRAAGSGCRGAPAILAHLPPLEGHIVASLVAVRQALSFRHGELLIKSGRSGGLDFGALERKRALKARATCSLCQSLYPPIRFKAKWLQRAGSDSQAKFARE